jgi:hypothetical protein
MVFGRRPRGGNASSRQRESDGAVRPTPPKQSDQLNEGPKAAEAVVEERSPRRHDGALRRVVVGIAVVAVATAGIVLPLSLLSELGGEKPPAREEEGRPATDTEEASPAGEIGRLLRFNALPGWHVVAFPGDGHLMLPTAWAANVPFAPRDLSQPATVGYPSATTESLPKGGVLLVASLHVVSRNPLPVLHGYPEGPLALEFPKTWYEGQQPGTSSAIAGGKVNRQYINVSGVFGDEHPSRELLAEANDQLARLVITPAPPPVRELDDFGIAMDLPEDWHGGLFASGDVMLKAGTLPITDLYDGTSVRPRMGPDDVFLVLVESIYTQDRFEPVQLPISLREEDECPTCEVLDNGRAPPPDHTLLARTFSVGNRRFYLYAEFGTAEVTDDRLEAFNDILATLRIDATGALEPSDPGAVPTMFPPGPSFTATEATPFEYRGVWVDVPAGWSVAAAPLSEPAVAPVVAAFGSWPFPEAGGCGPEPALGSLPADGALVWLAEHPGPSNRGDYYRFTRYGHDRTSQPMRWECGSSAPSRMLLWRLEGRYFEVHIALGSAAGPDRIAAVEALLNSLRVESSMLPG